MRHLLALSLVFVSSIATAQDNRLNLWDLKAADACEGPSVIYNEGRGRVESVERELARIIADVNKSQGTPISFAANPKCTWSLEFAVYASEPGDGSLVFSSSMRVLLFGARVTQLTTADRDTAVFQGNFARVVLYNSGGPGFVRSAQTLRDLAKSIAEGEYNIFLLEWRATR